MHRIERAALEKEATLEPGMQSGGRGCCRQLLALTSETHQSCHSQLHQRRDKQTGPAPAKIRLLRETHVCRRRVEKEEQ